jgi:hypothetical protein
MAAVAGNTTVTLVVYACSVCSKSFGDIYSSCAKHVNGRGKCKERGATVVPVPVNFSRNDRQVGGRIGHLPGPGGLASRAGLEDNSDMERADADSGGPASPPQAPLSGIILILHTYPHNLTNPILNYPENLTHLILNYPDNLTNFIAYMPM